MAEGYSLQREMSSRPYVLHNYFKEMVEEQDVWIHGYAEKDLQMLRDAHARDLQQDLRLASLCADEVVAFSTAVKDLQMLQDAHASDLHEQDLRLASQRADDAIALSTAKFRQESADSPRQMRLCEQFEEADAATRAELCAVSKMIHSAADSELSVALLKKQDSSHRIYSELEVAALLEEQNVTYITHIDQDVGVDVSSDEEPEWTEEMLAKAYQEAHLNDPTIVVQIKDPKLQPLSQLRGDSGAQDGYKLSKSARRKLAKKNAVNFREAQKCEAKTVNVDTSDTVSIDFDAEVYQRALFFEDIVNCPSKIDQIDAELGERVYAL